MCWDSSTTLMWVIGHTVSSHPASHTDSLRWRRGDDNSSHDQGERKEAHGGKQDAVGISRNGGGLSVIISQDGVKTFQCSQAKRRHAESFMLSSSFLFSGDQIRVICVDFSCRLLFQWPKQRPSERRRWAGLLISYCHLTLFLFSRAGFLPVTLKKS